MPKDNCQNLTPSSKKPLFYKEFLTILVCLIVLSTSHTHALSVANMLGSLGETLGIVRAQGKENQNEEKILIKENIQNLKVFEPNKNIKAVISEKTISNKFLANQDNNTDLTLSPDKENFYAGESLEQEDENMHSDNAIYRVQRGESIYSIASYFSISPETILSLNKLSEKEILPGVVLEVPPIDGLYYEIKKGDSLRKLADKYKVELDDITLYNGLLENEDLAVGEEIFIPGVKPEQKVGKKKDTKDIKSPSNSNKNLATKNTPTIIDPVLGNLSKYIKNFGRGSTAQKSKISDVKKYASLPKYPNYYIMPAPGTNRTQTMHGHNGSDFAGPIGSPVLASAGGTVRVAKASGYNFGYGNYIIITHANGSETVYAHLSKVFVNPGQNVSQGQSIGAIGSSGNSTGPHLHFEIRGAYNPWAW